MLRPHPSSLDYAITGVAFIAFTRPVELEPTT
jgi:hypothetical protein